MHLNSRVAVKQKLFNIFCVLEMVPTEELAVGHVHWLPGLVEYFFIVSGTGQAKQVLEAKITSKAQKPSPPHMKKLIDIKAFSGICRFGQYGIGM